MAFFFFYAYFRSVKGIGKAMMKSCLVFSPAEFLGIH